MFKNTGHRYKQLETFIAEEIFNQIIWNNSYITIKNKPIERK